jgi:predicted DNA-binding transcriptional regulator YafY
MRRADRLFDIIQSLRTATHPVTAAALAERLEVTVRTIYRDIAAADVYGRGGRRDCSRRAPAAPAA